MKNKLIKSFSMTLVALATVVIVVMGVSKDVKADDWVEWPTKYQLGETTVLLEYTEPSRGSWTENSGYYECSCHSLVVDKSNKRINCPPPSAITYYLSSFDGEEKTFTCPTCRGSVRVYEATPPAPTPTPTPSKSEDKKEAAKEAPVDHDTFKSEAPYGTVGVTNNNSKIGDLKVHKVTAVTEANQTILANDFAKKAGKRARILTTVSVHPRRDLGADNGKMEALIWNNLEKKVQPVYAVCYNQKDGAYFISGTLDANGTAKLNNFVLRDATNVTIFVLE